MKIILAGLLLGLALSARAQVPGTALDLRGCAIRGARVVDAAGREVGQISADESRGAKVQLTPEGGVVFKGEMYGEALATLTANPAPTGDTVFETHFVLTQPRGFYSHLAILSPRVAPGPEGAAYRISYRFAGPCPVANNNTGFFLINTGTEPFRKEPLWAPPAAGAPYRLAYGREYVAYTVVRDLPAGVRITFYLHDTTLKSDDEQPLFDYTDTSPERIPGGAGVRVQVGTGGLISPAAPVWFGGMKLYPLEHLADARRQRAPTPNLPLQALTLPAESQRTELPNLFSDNLVVQRGKPVTVWGRGLEGDEVTVRLATSTARARVAGGRWRVDLAPLPAGGPHELTVTGRDRTLSAHNVMVGEVWVIGGQSNMGWYMQQTTEAEREVPRSDFPAMRVFSGWHPAAGEPQFEVAGGTWKVISPELKGAFSAVGYYFCKELHRRLKVPVAWIDTSTPATGIECWLSGAAAEGVWGKALHERPGRFLPGLGDPACYFNGKVAPVMPLGVAGMLWYQGDGSLPATGTAYRRYIPALIRDWRQDFGQGDLPFFIVQIPRFEGCSPQMREAQLLAALGAPNAGVAVTLDVGEAKDIHPRNKRPVGERLARLARAMVYGERIECMGPIYQRMEVKQGKAYLSFTHTGRGLVLKGEGGFEVRGAAGPYLPAHAALTAAGQVVVWSDAVPRPEAVRYAWAPVPEISLYNREGLLASPFRTRED